MSFGVLEDLDTLVTSSLGSGVESFHLYFSFQLAKMIAIFLKKCYFHLSVFFVGGNKS